MIIVVIIICILFLIAIFSFGRIIDLLGHTRIMILKELFRHELKGDKSNNIYTKLEQKPLWSTKRMLWYIILSVIFGTVFYMLPNYLWRALQKAIIFTDPDAIYLSSVGVITLIPVIFVAVAATILITQLLTLLIDRHAARKHNKVPTPQNSNIKLTLWITIFLFTLGLPFIILNTDYYSYVKGNSFYTNRFFSLSEEKYDLSYDVDHAEVTYNLDGEGLDYSFYYNIYFKDNTKVEILRYSEIENVVLVNNKLKNNKINIILEDISESRWADIEQYCPDDLVYFLKRLYNVEST